MDTTIICALISACGVVLSAVASYMIARNSARKEIALLKLSWAREDVTSSADAFGAMSEAVARYIGNTNHTNQCDALAKIGLVRANTSGELGATLDALHNAVLTRSRTANDLFAQAIDQNRKRDSR